MFDFKIVWKYAALPRKFIWKFKPLNLFLNVKKAQYYWALHCIKKYVQICLITQLLIQTHGSFYFFKACESINKFYITVRKYATPSKNFKFTPPFLSNWLIIQQHCFFLRIVLTPRLSFHFLWKIQDKICCFNVSLEI